MNMYLLYQSVDICFSLASAYYFTISFGGKYIYTPYKKVIIIGWPFQQDNNFTSQIWNLRKKIKVEVENISFGEF